MSTELSYLLTELKKFQQTNGNITIKVSDLIEMINKSFNKAAIDQLQILTSEDYIH